MQTLNDNIIELKKHSVSGHASKSIEEIQGIFRKYLFLNTPEEKLADLSLILCELHFKKANLVLRPFFSLSLGNRQVLFNMMTIISYWGAIKNDNPFYCSKCSNIGWTKEWIEELENYFTIRCDCYAGENTYIRKTKEILSRKGFDSKTVRELFPTKQDWLDKYQKELKEKEFFGY